MSDNLGNKINNLDSSIEFPTAPSGGYVSDSSEQEKRLNQQKNRARKENLGREMLTTEVGKKAGKIAGKGIRVGVRTGGKAGEITGKGVEAGGKVAKKASGIIGEAGGRAGKELGKSPGRVMETGGKGLRIGSQRVKKGAESTKKGLGAGGGDKTAQQLNQIKNIAKKALSENPVASIEEGAQMASSSGSKFILTTFWGSVWLDWTLLSLLGLNVFLAKTVFLGQNKYICNLGEDYAIGRWIPSKLAAKYIEIIIIITIDIFIASIIMLMIYLIYAISNALANGDIGSWRYLVEGAKLLGAGLTPGGDTWSSQFSEAAQNIGEARIRAGL